MAPNATQSLFSVINQGRGEGIEYCEERPQQIAREWTLSREDGLREAS